MKTRWGWRYSSTHSLTSALGGGEWSASRPGQSTPRERAPGVHWIGGWVGPRVGLGAVELSLCFNWAPRHGGVLGEWRYSSAHSLTSALDGGAWWASRPGRFTPTEITSGTHWIGGWVGPRAILDAVVKRKIPSPRRESKPRTLIVQLVGQRYTVWGWMYSATHSLTSALEGGEWSDSRPGRLTPKEKAPGVHWIGGWVDPRAGLGAMEKRKIPSSPPLPSNPLTHIIHPIASRYTDWATPALKYLSMCLYNCRDNEVKYIVMNK
jgi:hypothetical protein